MEVEDDLLFADLSRQISRLILDDDEDPVASYPSVSFQAFTSPNYPTAPSPFFYGQSRRRESKGTGVFIPRSSQPRKKNGQGRFNSFNAKSHRQHHKARTVSQASDNNSFNPKNQG